jgi:hypothetical protein
MANSKLPDLINAKNLYNELYFLKTAIQLQFNELQYAAILNLGRRIIKSDLVTDLN